MEAAFTSFVLAYHGCDERVAEGVFSGKQLLLPSSNDYDWLGDGIYFWEHNAQRAYEFACETRDRPAKRGSKVRKPAVVGAIIDLASCLNLLDSRYIELVRDAYESLLATSRASNTPLPQNRLGSDLLLRELDCAVIRFLHYSRRLEGKSAFDTVRAAFMEGGPLYENAGFSAKNHIQICVRNMACIKGYFRPLGEDGKVIRF